MKKTLLRITCILYLSNQRYIILILMDENNASTRQIMILPIICISKGKVVNAKEMNKSLWNIVQFISINSSFIVFDCDKENNDGDNKEIIIPIVKKYHCYVGGGLKTNDDIREYLSYGASKVVINLLIIPFINQTYNDFIITSIEIKEDNIQSLLLYTIDKQSKFILLNYTITNNEFDHYATFLSYLSSLIKAQNIDITITIALNINTSSSKYIRELPSKILPLGICPIIPLSVLASNYSLGDIYSEAIDYIFLKQLTIENPQKPILIPLIIIKDTQIPLGITFTTKEYLKESIDRRLCVFYSRDKQKKWIKGETSKYYHHIIQISLNYQRRYIVFTVKGNKFCHMNYDSCFNLPHPYFLSELFSLETFIKQSKSLNCNYNSLINHNHNQGHLFSKSFISFLLEHLISFLINKGISIEILHKENILFAQRYLNNKSIISSNNNTYSHYNQKKIVIGILIQLEIDSKENIIDQLKKNHFIIDECKIRKYSIESMIHGIKILYIVIRSIDDAIKLFDNNTIDALLTYSNDDDEEYDYLQSLIRVNSFKGFQRQRTLCAISRESIDLLQQKQNKSTIKYNLMTTNISYATKWSNNHNIITNIIHVYSNPFQYFLNYLCDIAICDYDLTIQSQSFQDSFKILITSHTKTLNLYSTSPLISSYLTAIFSS